jgi:hypothetical protein
LKNKVTLQINLAPSDYLHARYILKHQLNILYEQVNEIILTIDTQPSKGRFAEGWETYKELLYNFFTAEIETKYSVKIIPVDYSEAAMQKVAKYFFDKNSMPEKDFRGGPFYAYFFGLYSAANNLIFHLDSDIFLGGSSKTWITEAADLFETDPTCFILSPLPGPPHADDILIDQDVINKLAPYTWQLNGMSTRVFMTNRSKFNTNKLLFAKPSLRNQVKALVEGNANADLPEHILSAYIRKNNLKRIDFLGSGNGLWSLHPPYRTKTFYDELQVLILRIELNDLPEKQQGFYDIVDEVCDWSAAKKVIAANRWWKRIFK